MPTCLVAVNDIFAYITGKLFGRTRLIELSPNKTLEGFIGGGICTVIAAFIVGKLFTYTTFFQHMICPQNTLDFRPYPTVSCEPPMLFVQRMMRIPYLSVYFGKFYLSEFQIHCMILALFSSLIAPFGGFFASGLKRALKIKDFSMLIPGHGGILDRFDCQVIVVSNLLSPRLHSPIYISKR